MQTLVSHRQSHLKKRLMMMSWPDSDDLVSSTVNHTAARAGPNAYTTVLLDETPGQKHSGRSGQTHSSLSRWYGALGQGARLSGGSSQHCYSFTVGSHCSEGSAGTGPHTQFLHFFWSLGNSFSFTPQLKCHFSEDMFPDETRIFQTPELLFFFFL